MRCLATITLLVLALALAQPVAAQSFKPDYDAGWDAYTKGDYATALKHFRPLAKQGYVGAQFNLGYMYLRGEGVTLDYAEAVRWFRKTAKQGDPYAQSLLGLMYYTGRGVTKDFKEAVRWLRKSAKQGYATAQYKLGSMYKDGEASCRTSSCLTSG